MVEGAPHTAKRSLINCVSRGAPLPPYIKEQGEAAGQGGGRAKGGVLLPPGVGLLLARLSPWPAETPLLLYIRG